MGLLVKHLPRYTGPHTVSTFDLELPVENRRTFGDATLKSTGQPALCLDTVLVTLYYPADPTQPGSGRRQPWVERPLNQTAAGYARFANQRPWLMKAIVWLFARGVRLPVEAERPLQSSAMSTAADSPPLTDARSHDSHQTIVGTDDAPSPGKSRFPVVVFSHGLSGTRTTYRYASRRRRCPLGGHSRTDPFRSIGVAANGVARSRLEATWSQRSNTGTVLDRSHRSDEPTGLRNGSSTTFALNI